MKIVVSSKLKLGFIDGSIVKPATTSNMYPYYTRYNYIVISWILTTVSPEIRQSILYIDYAHDIWVDLSTRFAHTNILKLFHPRK